MAFMVYLILVTARSQPKIWDPYEILGLSRSADESQIKKHYRRLSITEHPDKRQPDPAKNETIQTINDHWVEVTKAFKTLTDEEIRNNYIQFGHPDGKQSFSLGIALPQFIVMEGNGKYVLLLYAALLGVLLPLLVGRWWYGTQSMTRDGILVDSASKLFREYNEELDTSGVISALSSGVEYEDRLSLSKAADDTSAKLETRLTQGDGQSYKLPKSEREKLKQMSDEKRRKIFALLWSYINRVELEDAQLNEQKYEVGPIACTLNESFTNMCLAFMDTRPLLSSYRATQHIMQALPPNASPLLQLPFFTPATIKAIETGIKEPQTTRSLESFMALADSKRRALTVQPSLLSASQYAIAMRAAAQIPAVRIERAFFKCVGERVLTPGSLVQFVIKLRFVPPGTDPALIPAVAPQDLEDKDPAEGDLDALHGRKKKGGDSKDGKDGKDAASTEERVQLPLAHAPFFPRDYAPRWRVFLADSRQNKVAVPAFTFSTFDKPIFREGSTDPTFAVQTLKMQFGAPPQVGKYFFTAHLVCDSYVGIDVARDVVMEIEEPSKAVEIDEEEDISEPEEGEFSAFRFL